MLTKNKIFSLLICVGFLGTTKISFSTTATMSLKFTDTLKYLRENFVGRKHEFQHKEFRTILKKLNLPVKSYSIGNSWKPSSTGSVIIVLYFDNSILVSEKLHQGKIASLIISFDSSVPLRQAQSLFFSGHKEWRKEEVEFYSSFIVKNIDTLKHSNPPIKK